MFIAEIRDYKGADYGFGSNSFKWVCFGSNSFKWVYYAAVKFARHCLHRQEDLSCIVIRFDNDIRVAVDRSGLTIDDNRRTIDINKEGR